MKTIIFQQLIPVSMDTAWDFFSSPGNLNLITPDNLHFNIISALPKKMSEGLIIRYRIRPMMNIPLLWVTQITQMEQHVSFTDEQIKGPYKIWKHQHFFQQQPDGVLMTDHLTYDIGWGPFGWMAGRLWVDQQVNKIFSFRREAIEKYFSIANIQRQH